jgi:hypothetical protein
MDPGAVIAIVAILFVGAPAVIFRGIRSLRVDRNGAQASRGGEMRASELKAMIRTAVDEATAPLAARVTDLEERLGDEPVHALRERLDGGTLAGAFDPDAEFDEPASGPARRARS